MVSSVPVECSNLLACCALHLKCFAEVLQHPEDVNLEGVPACTHTIGQLLQRWKLWQLTPASKAGTYIICVAATVGSSTGEALLLFPKWNLSVH